ncbi:MAG: DegT/DnrJ/EryC1/StrS family aminotransferase [Planctomycetota bacterium]
MKVPFYGHVKQYNNIRAEIDANIKTVLESGEFVMGPMLKRFEAEFAAYHGMKFGIGVGNGTDAIWLTLMALGVGPGDEVITHPNTFFATAEAIWIAGATVVLVDCCPTTKTLCPDRVRAAITPKTKAIIPVHLYGQCAYMKEIRKIADEHKLFVIEDNAQAIDSAGDGFKVGELSDAVATSFIIQKNLGTFGDGGAVVTNNPEIDRKIRKLRNHGSEKRSFHSYGFNSRLDDIHAGILSAKLKHLREWSDLRRKWAARYDQGLKGCRCLDLPYVEKGFRHVFHLYAVETKRPQDRDALVKHLNAAGVDAKMHYPIAIHQQEGYPWGKGARVVGSVANAEANAACCVSLPMFPELTAAEVDFTVATVLAWEKAHPEACSDKPGAARADACGCGKKAGCGAAK